MATSEQKLPVEQTELEKTEQALLKATALLNAVLKNTSERIYFKDQHSRFVRFNQAFLDHLRVSDAEEPLGKTDFHFFTEEYAVAAEQEDQSVIREGKVILNREERETHRDGRVTWASTSKMPWYDHAGKIKYVMGFSRDITELKKAQEETARAQVQLQLVLDAVPIGVSMAHIDPEGRVASQMINDEHLRICGITREEASKWQNFRAITHPDDLPTQDALTLQVAEGKIDHFSMEKRYIKPNGETAWVLFSFRMRNNLNGCLEDLFTVVDITERKKAEEKLQVSTALFHMAGELFQMGGWSIEFPDRTLHWTEEVHRIHEVPSGYEPTLEKAIAFYTPESADILRQAFENSARDGTPYDLELDLVTAKNRRIRVRTTGQAEFKDSQLHRMFGIIQDITETQAGT